MAEEERKDRSNGVSRRDFVTGASAALGGATLGMALASPADPKALAAVAPKVDTRFVCPIDNQSFDSFEALKKHFAEAHPAAAIPVLTKLKVNGKDYEVQIEPQWTLQRTLQFKLGMYGAKTMCNRGECGSCTVIIDGRPALSCTVLAVECEGKEIETIEGIAADPKWLPLIHSYGKWDAMQCGYCTPGFVVAAKALLTRNPNPTEDEVKQALSGNICICGTYPRHPKAVQEAAQVMKGGA
jgi:aerobic-type carbon monoxide dehydrogenase small subunit (CoxS/CutS family)